MRQFGKLASSIVAKAEQTMQNNEPIIELAVPAEAKKERPTPLSAKAPHRGYLARELVQCTMPHSDPKKDVYIRTDGKYRLMIESGTNINTGEKIGLPYGPVPRLLMLYVNTEVVRKQGNEDELLIGFGSTMNEFIRKVGYNPATGGGKRGDAARIRAQHQRLFSARFTFVTSEGNDLFGSEIRRPIEIATEIRTFWDYRNPDQGSFWESYIKLTPEFHKALVTNPVPFDFEHLKALKGSALALDLYCWLTYRIYRANGDGFVVPYSAMHQQFGTGYGRERDFRAAMAQELAVVARVYSDLKYEFTPRGLSVEPISRRDLPVPSENRPSLPPMIPHGAPQSARPYNTTALAVFGTDLQKIDRLARQRGMNLDDLIPLWRAWCIDNKVTPKNAAAHLTNFVKNHNPNKTF